MTLEQSLSRSIATKLATLPRLSGVMCVAANADDQQTVPRVVVEVVRGPQSVAGHDIYACDVAIQITANAFAQASNDQATSGNQNVELLFDQIEGTMTGDPTQFSTGSVKVWGSVFHGGVTDHRDHHRIQRDYKLTMHAESM